MTAIRPGSQPAKVAPDRTWWLLIFAIITSTLLLFSHESNWRSALPDGLGNLLGNPLLGSIILTLFLSNLLFAFRWKAAPWAKMLVFLGSLFFVLPWAGRDDTGIFDLAIQIGIFAALALGLNIVVGLAGLLDLGYIAFFAVGAYSWGIFSSGQFSKILTYFADNGGGMAVGNKYLFGGLVLTIASAVITASINRVKGKRNAGQKWGAFLAGLGLVIGLICTVRGVAILLSPEAQAVMNGLNPQFFWLWLILALFAAASVGVLIGLPVLKLKGDYLAIITLGLGEVIRVLANNLTTYTNGTQGITPIPTPSIPFMNALAKGLGFAPEQYNLFFLYFLVLMVIALVIMANIRLDRSRIGRAWIAIREDEVAAQAMGVPLMQTKLIAFATGASFAGVMGVIFAAKQTFISPESFILTQSTSVLCMVVLGGLGSIPGVIVGAAIVTILNLSLLPSLGEVTSQMNNPVLSEISQYQRLVFGSILVLMMLYRPEGLLPSVREQRLLHEDDDPTGNLSPQDSQRAALASGVAGEVYSPGEAPQHDNERTGGSK